MAVARFFVTGGGGGGGGIMASAEVRTARLLGGGEGCNPVWF